MAVGGGVGPLAAAGVRGLDRRGGRGTLRKRVTPLGQWPRRWHLEHVLVVHLVSIIGLIEPRRSLGPALVGAGVCGYG